MHKDKEAGFDPLVVQNVFCIVCSSHEYNWKMKKTPKGIKWIIDCKDCHHKTHYSYCVNKQCINEETKDGNDDRNRLIKHGPYWTYHATQVLEPYNIKCPKCGEIVVPL